jgi:deoxyribonuclease-4
MLLGAHESVAGGLERAFAHAESHACEAIQIFTKNANQWREPSIADPEVAAFRQAHRAFGQRPLIAHESYLVNLCSDREDILVRSQGALLAEMDRSERLGISFIAFHPGAAVGLALDEALRRIGDGLASVLEATRGRAVRLCIENTAGQGSTLGSSIDEIAAMIEAAGPEGHRLGVCLDTQHLFAAGYDMRTPAGYDAFFDEFDRKVGIARIACFHLNDSKKPLGQRVDRHEEIGIGEIGLYPFWRLVNDPRLTHVPGVVELPAEVAAVNVKRLRELRGVAEPVEKRIVPPLVLTPPPGPRPSPGGGRGAPTTHPTAPTARKRGG